MPHLLRPWAQAFTNLIFPRECESCRSPIGPFHFEERLCHHCYEALSPISHPYCPNCAEPFAAEDPAPLVCPNCTDRKSSFDFAYAPYEYRGPVRDLIHRFKYDREIHLRQLLGQLLSHGLTESRIVAQPDWILTPVPLHNRRYREREFNQANEIARVLSKLCPHPFIPGLLRNRYTSGQAKLDRRERLKNLKGAFSLTRTVQRKKLYAGRHVLIIDDVLTTGATIHECAQVLKKEGGAASVVGLCVARG